MKRIAVIGAGAWGTAIAAAAERAGSDVTLWARETEVVEAINNHHENTVFLAGIPLSPSIKATDDLAPIIASDALFLVVPSQFLGGMCKQLKEAGLPASTPLVLCSKGIERGTLRLMTEVVEEVLPENPLAVMSGPTFASEVAKGLPASVTIACEDKALRKQLSSAVRSPSFKVYKSDDLIGAEIGGAMKNVIAIACGIVEGSGLGKNAIAALITRGLREMERLCVAKGGRPETLMKLCGVGDLILTCNSHESRNNSLGYALGKGQTLEDIMGQRRTVAEGVDSAESVVALARSLDLELPICVAVNRIVHGRADIKKTIEDLIRSS